MTEERHTRESAAETDPVVARTYRESADERAPEHLNQAILKEAAKAAKPRYRRSVSWTRPMAWAATVMLSVALVLEVTKVPAPSSVTFDDNADKFEAQELESDLPAGTPSADAPAAVLEESVVPATPQGRVSNAATAAPPQNAAFKSTAKLAAPATEVDKRQRANVQQEPVAAEELATPAINAVEFKLKDTDMLRRAEAPGCDDSVTVSPETWLECIRKLEEAGLADAAQQQRESLREAYPDFNPD